MVYFSNSKELEFVIGGFLKLFPRFEPLMRELINKKEMILKLELKEPEFSAEVDFKKYPLEIRLNTNADGTIGMTSYADDFHRLLLGMFSIGVGVNQKKLLLRGSVADMMDAIPLFYVAPSIYPFYLESINRPDLIIQGERPPLHAEKETEDIMTKIVSGLAYLVGYGLGFIKRYFAKKLDIIVALESMGKGLLKATSQKNLEQH